MKRLKRKHVEQGEGVLRLFSEAYPISHGRLILNDKLNGTLLTTKMSTLYVQIKIRNSDLILGHVVTL